MIEEDECKKHEYTLPVSFLDVKAVKKNNAVLVTWSTASETNNDFFLVERSFDRSAFDVISDKIKGAGNSNHISTYSYTDQLTKTNAQVVYYRIRQVDSLETPTKVHIVLYNILRQPVTVLKDELTDAGSYETTLPQLSPGIYLLNIETRDHTETIRVISK